MIVIAKDNISKYVILGILSIRSMSGYEIKDYIKTGVGYFWNISYGQIYPALKAFENDNLVTYKTEKEIGRPEKKVYSITESGRGLLDGWLREPIDYNAAQCSSMLLLKIFFGANVPIEVTIKHIEEYKHSKIKLLQELQRVEERSTDNYKKKKTDDTFIFRMSTLHHGIASIKTQIDWCDATINNLHNSDSKLR